MDTKVPFSFGKLSHVTLETIVATFNEAFADYYVPLRINKDSLIEKIRAENINLEASVGVFREDNMVAFLLHGLRNKSTLVAYNGGTGVKPGFRGQLLTEQMYEFILPLLQAQGVTQIRLEVLDQNEIARKVYSRIGFQFLRDLNCYRGEISRETDDTENVVQLPAAYLVQYKHFSDWKPTWQHEEESIVANSENCKIIGQMYDQKVVGYLAYQRSTGRVLQLAVDPAFRRRGIASHLLGQIGGTCTFINVDAHDVGTNAFLKAMGLNKFAQQAIDQYLFFKPRPPCLIFLSHVANG